MYYIISTFFSNMRESKKRLISKIFHNDHNSINKIVVNVTYGFFFMIHDSKKLQKQVIYNFLDIHPLIVINAPI